MGIPLYFKKLTDEYNDIVISTDDIQSINRLFLDLNCAIHPCCKRMVSENYKNSKKDDYEKKMLTEIISYMVNLKKKVKPSDLLFIAIDGVAPKAKMEQQRLRRYKSIDERKIVNNIKKEIGEEVNEDFWDSNAITPGTDFIKKISNRIKHEIKNNKDLIDVNIIFSDSSVAGEGEHKIFEYIRDNRTEGNDVVYGLDADLIMLSLSSKNNNIYLLRESLEFGKAYYECGYKYLYLNIDVLKEYLLMEIKERMFDQTTYSMEVLNYFIDDYVVICFMLGNDFLPHLPSISLREDGLGLILDKYVLTYLELGENLVNVEMMKINTRFLLAFIYKLAEVEDESLQKFYDKRRRFRVRRGGYQTELDRRLDNLHNLPSLENKEELKLHVGGEGWRGRYYKKCFGMVESDEISMVCHNYISGMVWVFHYYFSKCISWSWYYHYRHGPSLIDLVKVINKVGDLNTIKFSKGTPNKPFNQLICVLPPSSSNLLPRGYQYLMTNSQSNIVQFYPKKFEYDYLFKRYFWQCIPKLPLLDDKKIKREIEKVRLSVDEKNRNSFGENLYFEKKINSI